MILALPMQRRAGQGLVAALREVPGRGALAGLDLADQRGRVPDALP